MFFHTLLLANSTLFFVLPIDAILPTSASQLSRDVCCSKKRNIRKKDERGRSHFFLSESRFQLRGIERKKITRQIYISKYPLLLFFFIYLFIFFKKNKTLNPGQATIKNPPVAAGP